MWFCSLGREDPPEESLATHSSVLAWRIPWTEEPGRLQSIGSQRVGHDWSDLTCTYTNISAIFYWMVCLFIIQIIGVICIPWITVLFVYLWIFSHSLWLTYWFSKWYRLKRRSFRFWEDLLYHTFLFYGYVFYNLLKKRLLIPDSEDHLLYLLPKVRAFNFYAYVLINIKFCVKIEIWRFFFFLMWLSNYFSTVCEQDFPFSIWFLWCFC